MNPKKLYNIIFIMACIFMVLVSWLCTMESTRRADYYQDKYFDLVVKNDAEIEAMQQEIMKLRAGNDLLLLYEYVLPQIQANEVISKIAQQLREME
jgi:hypothetical protein